MAQSDGWFTCRVSFVETARAIGLAAGRSATRVFRSEWPAFGVIEINQSLAEHAADLTGAHNLRSLDALHLAAALLLPSDDVVVATWDVRLHAAAHAEGLSVVPQNLP